MEENGAMAKRARTVETETGKKGVEWKQVRAKSLGKETRDLYKQYAEQFEAASELAADLKEKVTAEWNKKYPDGKGGQICTFNAIGGVLLYVMKDIPKPKKRAGKEFDEDAGDDVMGPQ
jgi:hypothetical protein